VPSLLLGIFQSQLPLAMAAGSGKCIFFHEVRAVAGQRPVLASFAGVTARFAAIGIKFGNFATTAALKPNCSAVLLS
jgi:hypothetical protein